MHVLLTLHWYCPGIQVTKEKIRNQDLYQLINRKLTAILLICPISAIHVSITNQRTLVLGQEIPASTALFISSILAVFDSITAVLQVDLLENPEITHLIN